MEIAKNPKGEILYPNKICLNSFNIGLLLHGIEERMGIPVLFF